MKLLANNYNKACDYLDTCFEARKINADEHDKALDVITCLNTYQRIYIKDENEFVNVVIDFVKKITRF